MKHTDYVCDICKKQRGSDANHWFVVSLGKRCIIVTAWQQATNEEIEQADSHLCGAEHLLKSISEWTTK